MFFMYYIVGLGNPGEEYKMTRHNMGRLALGSFVKNYCDEEPEFNKKLNALTCEGKIKKEKFALIFPETFMNKSGNALKPVITSKKKAESLIVVHDDLDMPLGKIKILFNRGSGGHKGVESVARAVKTEGFIRIKAGISPSTPSGKTKKPDGKKVVDFIVGKFSPRELELVKKVSKKIASAVETIVLEGLDKAMCEFN